MSEDPKTNDVDINTKIFPMENTNRKGNRVGKIIVSVNNSASTNIDQINHYLKELFAYIKWASTKKNPKDETIEDKQKSIHDFFKAIKIQHIFSPKVVDEKKGAGRRRKPKKTMKHKSGKMRRNKRKTTKYRGGGEKEDQTRVSELMEELGQTIDNMITLQDEYINLYDDDDDDEKKLKEQLKSNIITQTNIYNEYLKLRPSLVDYDDNDSITSSELDDFIQTEIDQLGSGKKTKRPKKTMKHKSRKLRRNKRKTTKCKGGGEKEEIEEYIKTAIERELLNQFEKVMRMYPSYKDYASDLIKESNMDDEFRRDFYGVMQNM
jgi:hypothetical protein